MTMDNSSLPVETPQNLTVFFFGDVVGKAGKAGLRKFLYTGIPKNTNSLLIANGENAAGGVGIDEASLTDLLSYGLRAVTLGDHSWHKRGSLELLEARTDSCIRPANYGEGLPGSGTLIFEYKGFKVGLFNLLGRVFSTERLECPFKTADKILEGDMRFCDIIICDIHAEATSEKIALGRYLDGRVHLVVGTHTHVQTADDHILPGGTAYITDLGMCGPQVSVIGMDVETATARFLSPLPRSYKVGRGDAQICGIECMFQREGEKGAVRAVTLKRLFHQVLL